MKLSLIDGGFYRDHVSISIVKSNHRSEGLLFRISREFEYGVTVADLLDMNYL